MNEYKAEKNPLSLWGSYEKPAGIAFCLVNRQSSEQESFLGLRTLVLWRVGTGGGKEDLAKRPRSGWKWDCSGAAVSNVPELLCPMLLNKEDCW